MENRDKWSGQKNNRILVIDDNPQIHHDFRQVLGNRRDPETFSLDSAEAFIFDDEAKVPAAIEPLEEDFQVDSAYQGKQGLEMVEKALAEGRPYAMAFVDIRMPPGWDGVETIAQIWGKYPQLQVVICTAYSDYSWEAITRNLGARDSLLILKKPFDNIEVMQLAHALTKKWLVTRQANLQLEDLDRIVRQRTKELEEANQCFSTAFKGSPLPMAICKLSDARFLEANENFLKLFEFQRDAVCGRTEHELGIWADLADQAKFWAQVRENGSVREMKCRVRVKSGAVREALVSAEELQLSPDRGLLVLFHDVTEQQKLEEQLRQSQKMDAVGQLASGVAHDFNNLLTIIRGHAELRCGTPGLHREVVDSFKQITKATERAGLLTRQLLTFSRRHMLQPKALEVNELIRNLGDMAQSLISEQIKFQCELAAILPPVHADASNLEQVLVNLIVNARDAMPHGGQLTIRTAVVEVDAMEAGRNPQARTGSFVRVSVEDTGSGMDPETLGRIFEPFFTTKPIGKGTGMGLAMVYAIVKQHAGWIKVFSEVGRGTTFQIFLPISAKPMDRLAEISNANPVVGGNERILLVEDEPALCALAAGALKAAGYQVLQAASGVEALTAWFSQSEKIDLLLSDIVLPGGMSGRKLAEKLTLHNADLKVILTSGHSSELKEQPSSHSDLFFVAKPYSTAALVKTVRICLDNEKSAEKDSVHQPHFETALAVA